MRDTGQLEKALGYTFQDSELCNLALTHRSAAGQNNERLEFLGDSILNHIIAESLFRRFPQTDEGRLSRMRAMLVKGETLADLGLALELGDYIRLGAGERKSGGHRRRSILADTVEALLGAILLDSDVEKCRQVVLSLYSELLEGIDLDAAKKDAKTQLQEYVQARNNPLPAYRLLKEEGEEHARQFMVECVLQKPALREQGSGSSRRKAEQLAAQAVLNQLKKNSG
ncbi:MAG: ribonuclease III [Halioglobus sp.]